MRLPRVASPEDAAASSAELREARDGGGLGGAPSAACELPKVVASSKEELAWRLFVAINCKTSGGRLTWET